MSSIKLPCALPLDVSPQHAHEYEQIAFAVRDQTVEVYKAYLEGKSIFDPIQWKRVKKRESVEVWGVRDRHPPLVYHRLLDPHIASPEIRAHAEWAPQIKLRLIGQTLGLVDDAMYGTTAPTEISMMMRSASIADEFVDHRNLLEIRLPTVEEPFTYSGLKWSVRSTYLGSLIKARDMTHIESTGFTEVYHNGHVERLGYIVYHSMSFPQLPPLSSQGIIRSRFSVCTLFRQATPNVVEIFSTTSLAPGGELPHNVTRLQAADALFAVCKMTESAMKKKLVWMQNARAYGRPNATSDYLPTWRSKRMSFSDNFHRAICEQCGRKQTALRSVTACGVCLTEVCSRCLTSQKLVYGDQKHEVHVETVAVCKGCIATAKRMDNSSALAVYEFVQPFDPIRSMVPRSSYAETDTTNEDQRSPTYELPLSYVQQSLHSLDESEPMAPPPLRDDETQFADDVIQHKLRLWRQINELCLQAEQTYRQTKQQGLLAQHTLERTNEYYYSR